MKIQKTDNAIAGIPADLLSATWEICPKTGDDCWTMAAVGDIGLSGKTALHLERTGNITDVFGDIAPVIQNADCSFGNLETPLIDNWSPRSQCFGGSSKWAPGLAEVGFNVLHAAANHMLDFGVEGFAQTLEAVRKTGITTLGAGETLQEVRQLVVQNVAGVRVGWLAAGHTDYKQTQSPYLWELDVEQLTKAVQKSKDVVDVLIVSLHWGPMLVDYPYIEQYRAAHQFVDNGASAVIMHHAHIVQPVEIYKGVPICYGLGNCIFDITEGNYQKAKNFTYYKYFENQTSALFYLTWQKNKCVSLSVVPFCLPEPDDLYKASFRLFWPKEPVARQILERINQISEDVKQDFSSKLQSQLQIIWKREISINLCLIVRHGQLWRIWFLLRSVRPRHFIAMLQLIFKKLYRKLKPRFAETR